MSTKILSAFILLMIFFWLFPVIEFFFFDNATNKLDLGIFILYQSTSILLAVAICSILSFFKLRNNNENFLFHDEIYVSKITCYLSILFFAIFLFFYLNSVSGVNDILHFSERYRSGYYKGSGFYTVGIVQFLPFALSLLIVKCKKLNIYIYICLFLLMLVSLLLGLRIFLLVVFFFLVIRLMTSAHRKLSLLLILLLSLFFISYKLILNDGMSDEKLLDILLHIAGRIRYRFLVYDSNFSYELSYAFGFITYPFTIIDGTLDSWKEQFALSIPNLKENMPFISLFSGVAFPISIVIFNTFGFMGFLLIFPIIVFFVGSLKYLYKSQSITISIWCLYLVYFCFTILIEDIYQFSKIPFMILLIAIINLYFLILQKKINLHGIKL